MYSVKFNVTAEGDSNDEYCEAGSFAEEIQNTLESIYQGLSF